MALPTTNHELRTTNYFLFLNKSLNPGFAGVFVEGGLVAVAFCPPRAPLIPFRRLPVFSSKPGILSPKRSSIEPVSASLSIWTDGSSNVPPKRMKSGSAIYCTLGGVFVGRKRTAAARERLREKATGQLF